MIEQVLIWFLTHQALSFIALPYIALLLPQSPDRGYGLSKVFGLWLFGFLFWILPALNVYSATPLTGWFLVLLLAVCAFALIEFSHGGFKNFTLLFTGNWKRVEALFLFGFAFFLGCRFCTPEIFWGEKPMDFTFLNYFTRLSNLPPQDPWAVGNPMHYYYLGPYLFAGLHKLTGISTSIGYNLCFASLGAGGLAALYSIFLWVTRSSIFSAVGSLLFLFSSNLEILRLAIFSGKPLDFHLWWASTRGFVSPAFAEYPIWGLIFADLHAHVIAIPFCVVFLGLLFRLLESENQNSDLSIFAHRATLGFYYGSLFLLNSWDFITYGLIVGLFLWGKVLLEFGSGRKFSARVISGLGDSAIIAVMAGFTLMPFLLNSSGAIKAGWGFAERSEFNSLAQILAHQGAWIGLIFSGFLLKILFEFRIAKHFLNLLVVLLIGLLPVGLGIISGNHRADLIPWPIIYLTSGLTLLGAIGAYIFRVNYRYVALSFLVFAGGLLLCLSELFYLIDRMNTIFKIHSAIWVFLAVSAISISRETFLRLYFAFSKWKYPIANFICRILSLHVPAVFSAVIFGGLLSVWIMVQDKKIDGPRPTLNGTAYLNQQNPEEAAAILWLNKNVKGIATVLEAYGPSYGPFTRIAMNTGLPTVLGWDFHVSQRGSAWNDIEMRKRDIKAMYTTSDLGLLRMLLLRYGVRYVVLGKLERETYKAPGLDKFERSGGMLSAVFRAGETAIYRVNY